ncbi:hypothetical protein Goarm_004964 [Gossypium armourianum]|uniref:Uncharacterized protein n=1 Tax=Gossypium armourianum TaxID=34283 RepID=A0A7J9JYE6_9ROSI|nr:hypothetical protein [Gossypium armourianum]
MDVSATRSHPTLELSRSIASGMLIQEKVQTLYMSLGEIEGLTNDKQLMH